MHNYFYNPCTAYCASSTPKNNRVGVTTLIYFRRWTYIINQYNHYKNNYAHLLIVCNLDITLLRNDFLTSRSFWKNIIETHDWTCWRKNMLVYLYCNSTAKLFSSIVIVRCLTKPTRRVHEGLPKDFTHILCPDVICLELTSVRLTHFPYVPVHFS